MFISFWISSSALRDVLLPFMHCTGPSFRICAIMLASLTHAFTFRNISYTMCAKEKGGDSEKKSGTAVGGDDVAKYWFKCELFFSLFSTFGSARLSPFSHLQQILEIFKGKLYRTEKHEMSDFLICKARFWRQIVHFHGFSTSIV